MKILLSGFSEKFPDEWKELVKNREYVYHPLDSKYQGEAITAVHLRPLMDLATKDEIDLIIFSDPESNKIVISTRKSKGGAFVFFNHHQLSAILTSLWVQGDAEKPLKGVKSIFISNIVEDICNRNEVRCGNFYDFVEDLPKAINRRYLKDEGRIYFGFDNDQGVMHTGFSNLEILEQLIKLEEEQSEKEETSFDYLLTLFQHYGFHKTKTISVDYSDKSHKKNYLGLIDKIKKRPAAIDYILKIEKIVDFKKGVKRNLLTGKNTEISSLDVDLLKITTDQNLSLLLHAENDRMVFYISTKVGLGAKENYTETSKSIDMEMIRIVQVLNKLLVNI